MSMEELEKAAKVLRAVSDVSKVSRNHRVPGTEDRRENVVEHSFSSEMLATYVLELLGLHDQLDPHKVDMYIRVHDFTERGLDKDYNAYAHAGDRDAKAAHEAQQMAAFLEEFNYFPRFTDALTAYEERADDEAWFAWTMEKTQALIADHNDGWRAHGSIGVDYAGFVAHHDDILARCYPPVQGWLSDVLQACKVSFVEYPKQLQLF